MFASDYKRAFMQTYLRHFANFKLLINKSNPWPVIILI